MSAVNLNKVIVLLREFTKGTRKKIEIMFVGGLALHYYGEKDRVTVDIDAEVDGDIETLLSFLRSKGIPAHLSSDISRWSIIGLPADYGKRAIQIYEDEFLTVKVLHPVDFVVSKLRRFTEEDLEDALFVTKKFKIKPRDVQNAADKAIANSPRDTTLLIFKKNIKIFINRMKPLKKYFIPLTLPSPSRRKAS